MDWASSFDTHIHAAGRDRRRYPVVPTGVGSDWWKSHDCTMEQVVARLDRAGVRRAVAVQAIGPYGYDNRYVLDASAVHPDQIVVVPAVDADSENCAGDIRALANRPRTVGVRLFGVLESCGWVVSESLSNVAFDAAQASGTTIVLTVFDEHLPLLRSTIARFPEVPVVVDHCAFATLDGSALDRRAALLGLADLPNLSVKVTSKNLSEAAEHGDPARLIAQVVECFGTERLVWGSDFPQTSLDYDQLLEVTRTACRDLEPEAWSRFVGGNAEQLFSTGPVPTP